MKVLTWNIMQGGSQQRLAKISDILVAHDPDVLVLTEFWEGPKGDFIRQRLRNAGWHDQYSSGAAPKENGLLIASKRTLSPQPPSIVPAERHRWMEVAVQELRILAVHIPMGPPKPLFWAKVLERAQQLVTGPALIIGDFNTGLPVDTEGTAFECGDSFERLLITGWHDAWRLKNGSHQEFSWYSHAKKKKNGFRLDHALVSDTIRDKVISCCYSHDERTARYSDHSALIVQLDL